MKYLFLLLIVVPSASQAAVLMNLDYPYYVFNDDGVIRYCLPPRAEGDAVRCWSDGTERTCIALSIDDGYIDCKSNEVKYEI